jgi:hypothetical protein
VYHKDFKLSEIVRDRIGEKGPLKNGNTWEKSKVRAERRTENAYNH